MQKYLLYLLAIFQCPPSCSEAVVVWSVGNAWIDSNEHSYDHRILRLSLSLYQNHTAEWRYDRDKQWISQNLWSIQKQNNVTWCAASPNPMLLLDNVFLLAVRFSLILTKLADEGQFFVAVTCGFPLEDWVPQYVPTCCSWQGAACPSWIGNKWTV